MDTPPPQERPAPPRLPLTRATTDVTARFMHAPGEFMPERSPLDDLVSRGRQMQKQLVDEKGVLSPQVVQKSLRRPQRPPHLADMVARAYSAESDNRTPLPRSPGMPMKPIAFIAHGERPMSSHPRFSGVPLEPGDDRLSVATNATGMKSEGDLSRPRFAGASPLQEGASAHSSIAPSIAGSFDFGFEEKKALAAPGDGSSPRDVSPVTAEKKYIPYGRGRSTKMLAPQDAGRSRERARSATPERRAATPVMQDASSQRNSPAKYTHAPNWQQQGGSRTGPPTPVGPGGPHGGLGPRQLSGDPVRGRQNSHSHNNNSNFILSQDRVRAVSPEAMEHRQPPPQGRDRLRVEAPDSRPGSANSMRHEHPRRNMRPLAPPSILTRNPSTPTPGTPKEFSTPARADSLPTPSSISEDSHSPGYDPNGPPSSYIYRSYTLPRGRVLDERSSLIFKESVASFLGPEVANSLGKSGRDSPVQQPQQQQQQPQQKEQDKDKERPQPTPQPSPQPSPRPKTSYAPGSATPTNAAPSLSRAASEATDVSAILRATAKRRTSPIRYPAHLTVQPRLPTSSQNPSLASLPVAERPAASLSAEENVNLGIDLHEKGDLAQSTYHLRLAAHAGHPTGMLMYALACRHGWGMKANPREGVEWLQKVSAMVKTLDKDSAALSSLEAKGRKAQLALSIYELGVSYMNGWGTEKDAATALSCFEIAGRMGDADALSEAGYCYANGVGTKKDLKKASWWYRRAEEKGVEMVGQSWIWKDKYLDEEEKAARAAKAGGGGGGAGGKGGKDAGKGGLFSRKKG